MALLSQSAHDKLFDVRISEKNITRGAVTAKDWEKYLKSLPDDSANALWVSVEEISLRRGGSHDSSDF